MVEKLQIMQSILLWFTDHTICFVMIYKLYKLEDTLFLDNLFNYYYIILRLIVVVLKILDQIIYNDKLFVANFKKYILFSILETLYIQSYMA